MTRRAAYTMAIGPKAPDWFSESTDERLQRCIAFLLLRGVLNVKDASALRQRVTEQRDGSAHPEHARRLLTGVGR